ncbi:MAG: DUF5663 domain-containing protein [Candidatus Sungiibacteriota bacterium]
MSPSTQTNILERLGLQELPEEAQIALLTKMTESVIKRIAVEVLEQLSEDDRTTLFALQEKGELEPVEKFLKEKIPEYDSIADKVVQEFTDEMRDTVAALKKAA